MNQNMLNIPKSMQEEFGKWNNGDGVSLESWIEGTGNFSLAVGYTTIFWPEFVEFEDYIFRKDFSVEFLREYENNNGANKQEIEWTANHIHLDSIQYLGCEDISKDKILLLGNVLKEIYQAKLKWQFPQKPCTVEFCIPENEDDLQGYQLSFWQTKHETTT